MLWCVGFVVVLAGCGTDEDGDGVDAVIDCDDQDPNIGGPTDWYPDVDGDTWGDGSVSVKSCSPVPNHTYRPGDCDDRTDLAHPGQTEVCDELGLDEDCDGLRDDADPSLDRNTTKAWFADDDGDGFGNPASVGVQACDGGPGTASNTDDCDDRNPAVHPAAAERCTGVDDDCDGFIDDADPSLDLASTTAWGPDADGDGHGDLASALRACVSPDTAWVAADDCDDADASVHPGASEVCDAHDVDEDCDGLADDADPSVDPASRADWFLDQDGDGYGDDQLGPTPACDDPSTSTQAFLPHGEDCEDGDPAVSPAASELCENGIDDNCDGGAPECRWARSESFDQAWYTYELGAPTGDVAVADLDGDGIDDLLAGVPIDNSDDGALFVMAGPVTSSTQDLAADAHFTHSGSGGGQLGSMLEVVDLDGDGVLEVVVADDLDLSLHHAPAPALLSTTPLSAVWTDWSTSSATGALSGALRALDDVDGDGLPDLAVGTEGSGRGIVLLIGSGQGAQLSAAQTWVVGDSSDRPLGLDNTVASGDLDGDGQAELVLGEAASEQSRVFLFSGPSGGLTLSDADLAVQHSSGGCLNGVVESGADLDGDGYEDLVVAGHWASGADCSTAHELLVVPGGAAVLSSTWTAEDRAISEAWVHFQQEMSIRVADLGDDTNLDLVVGGTSFAEDWARVEVYYGPPVTRGIWGEDARVSEPGEFGRRPAFGDLDDDGDLDYFSIEDRKVMMMENRGM